jgi:hypothetical protein
MDIDVNLHGSRGLFEWAFGILNVPVSHLVSWSPKRLEVVAVHSFVFIVNLIF